MRPVFVMLALFPVLPAFAADNSATPAKDAAKPDTAASAKKVVRKKSAKASPAPVTKIAEPLVIPKTATPNGDGTYNFKDKQGKQWRYMATPFGVSRVPASTVLAAGSSSAAPPAAAPDAIKAIDRGDSVRFEHATPFGTTAWERKKTDLTDDERRAFESQNPPVPQPAAASVAPAASNAETHD